MINNDKVWKIISIPQSNDMEEPTDLMAEESIIFDPLGVAMMQD